MHLCSFTLFNSPSLTCQFSQLLVSVYGSTLKISQIDPETAKLVHAHTSNQFSQIIKLFAVGPTSFAVLDDSGTFRIHTWSNNKLSSASHNFSRSGLRRSTPCFGASDPQQRVVLIAAIDRHRYAYVLGVDSALSGPIDCSITGTYCYDLVAINVGYANPLFCQIEARGNEERCVCFYEFNLGLNLLVAKQRVVAPSAYLLCVIPQGVLVFRDNGCDFFGRSSTRPIASLPLPSRVACATTHTVKQNVFTLLQTVDGKIYKIDHTEGQMTLKLFGSAPVGTALHLFKSGFLYISSQQTDHALYQFISLGEQDEVIASSEDKPLVSTQSEREPPQPETAMPDNIELVDTVPNLARSTCLRLGAARSKVQTRFLTGSGQQLRSLESGLEQQDLVASPLGSTPLDVLVTGDPISKLILICFADKTTVLEVTDSVKEISLDLAPGRTLCAGEIDGTLVQVHAMGIRQMFKTPIDWSAGSPIIACSLNQSQVLIGLEDGTLIYFEQTGGALQQKFKQKVGRITCLGFSGTLALAGIEDTLRVFSLETVPQLIAVQQLSSPASSLLVQDTSLHLGLDNGVYMIAQLKDGAIVESKQRFMGSGKVRMFKGWFSQESIDVALVKCGSSTWASFSSDWFDLSAGPRFDAVAPFSSQDIPQALVLADGATLRIIMLENSKNRFTAKATGLPSLPKAIMGDDVLCATGIMRNQKFELYEYTAVAATTCRLDGTEYFAVGLLVNPEYRHFKQTFDRALIQIYHQGNLLHATNVPNVSALAAFKDRLLVGCNGQVLAYALGTKQLLRKYTIELPGETRVMSMASNRNRLFVAGSRRSITVFALLGEEFIVVADDPVARPVSSMALLDYDTVAIGDRFGNFSVLRVPEAATSLCASDLHLKLLAAKPGRLNGAHYKLSLVSNFFLGDVVAGMQLGVFTPGGVEVILWLGVNGTIGILAPVDAEEYDALKEIEASPREHLRFRGTIAPPKGVVDGDLCLGSHQKRIVELRARCI